LFDCPLVSAGIDYEIACEGEEDDHCPGGGGMLGWQLEATRDVWVARGVRKACGFPLTEDPENALKRERVRVEVANEPGDESEEEDDDDW
jgi:hypothetical protein